MTDTVQTQQETEVKPVENPMPPYLWLNNGVPLVVGGGKKTIELMKAQGFQIFYMLTELGYSSVSSTGNTQTTKYNRSTRLVKVVSNFVGDAIVEVDKDETLKLDDVKSAASFMMPRIPFSLVNEIDRLFRFVHDKNKTEAIVVLTYDPTFKDSEDPGAGWGYLVPKQNNTSGSCKYDGSSIIDEKDDHIVVVGTAHSHPAMQAYASHTDEADQATFDGLHMTFGWAPNSTETNYHIELQMGGGRFKLQPAAVFADAPVPKVDDKIVKLVEDRIHKGYTPKATTPTWQGGTKHMPGAAPGSQDWSGGYGVSSQSSFDWKGKTPQGLPDPETITLIRKTLQSESEITECPVCETNLFPYDKIGGGGKCWRCKSYFLAMGKQPEDLKSIRERQNKPTAEIDWKDNRAVRSVWLWEEVAGTNDKGEPKITEQIRPIWLKDSDLANQKGMCPECKVDPIQIIAGACSTCKKPVKESGPGKAQKIVPATTQPSTEVVTTKTSTGTFSHSTSNGAGGSGKGDGEDVDDDVLAYVAVSCAECLSINEEHEEFCVVCQYSLHDGYWVCGEAAKRGVEQTKLKPKYNYHNLDIDVDIESDEAQLLALGASIDKDELIALGSRYRMCCLKDMSDCQCNYPITFSTVLSVASEKMPNTAYLDDGPDSEGDCYGCVFKNTYECEPLIDMLKNWMKDESLWQPSLNGCPEYVPQVDTIQYGGEEPQ